MKVKTYKLLIQQVSFTKWSRPFVHIRLIFSLKSLGFITISVAFLYYQYRSYIHDINTIGLALSTCSCPYNMPQNNTPDIQCMHYSNHLLQLRMDLNAHNPKHVLPIMRRLLKLRVPINFNRLTIRENLKYFVFTSFVHHAFRISRDLQSIITFMINSTL